MLKQSIKLILCGVMSVATVLGLGAYSNAAHAESGKYVLTVSPSKQEVGELQPGQKYTGKFEVINDGTEAFDYKVYVAPFQVQNEQYDSDYETENKYTTISNWVTFSAEEGSLQAGETDVINYYINVPDQVTGGGQYAAIMVETKNTVNGESTVGATSRIAMAIYSHVAGNTTECAKINNTSIPGFLLNPPISASSTVENCGNVELNAEYTLRVYPLFSDEEIYTNEDKPDTKTILPETRRYNNVTWSQSPALGIYKVEQTVKIADQTKTISKMVVVCPIWLIVLIILFIAAVVFWLTARNRERNNRSHSQKVSAGSR